MREIAAMIYPHFEGQVHQSLRFTWRKATRKKRVRVLYESYDPLAQRVLREAIFKDYSKQDRLIGDAMGYSWASLHCFQREPGTH